MTSQHTTTTTTHNHDHQQHHQDDASHIFSVAAKNLQDCVELLQSVKAAIVEEQEQEQEALAGVNGSNHDDTNNDNTPGSNKSRLTNSFQPSKANNATSRINAVDIHHMSRTASQGSEESTTTTLREEGDEDEGSMPKESKVTPSTTSSSLSQHQQRHQRAQGSTTKRHLPPPAQICITPCKKSEIYTRPSTLACNGTIGKHVRHLHDHYRLLLTTYPKNQDTAGQWRVDYDARSREVPMETNIDVAIEELEKIQFMLEDYRDTLYTDHHHQQRQHDQEPQERFDLLQPVTLQATIDPARAPVRFQSTFGRELWFCSLHAVHHFAMIKVICGEYGMSLMEGFGLAPSTVQHRLAK
ncbi:hypothetical protein BG006_009822 [Podila minutissima]|uniref:Uncharacterized protein n=1 Tax=Podila minutissima TaxID=64525 RepID=A0A9P5VJ56_9FUNG|nr:hypothetical protein BG006_009822 [Podila minutissima]